MRIILRSGSIETSCCTTATPSPEGDFSVHPALVASSSAGLNNLETLDEAPTCQNAFIDSEQCGVVPAKKRSSNRVYKALKVICASLMVVCVSVMVQQAKQPDSCFTWSDRTDAVAKAEQEWSARIRGQDLAKDIILAKIQRFLDMDATEREKPLLLVFYGPSGTGKSFAAELLGETLMSAPNDSKRSAHAKRYVVPDYHGAEARGNPSLLRTLTEDNRLCRDSGVYLLEDLDLAHKNGWLGILAPLLSSKANKSHPDNSQHAHALSNAIIILTVRSGSEELIRKAGQLLAAGLGRHDRSANVMEKLLNDEHPDVQLLLPISRSVDAFVPFLPLEEEQVVYCIEKQLKAKQEHGTADVVKGALSLVSFESHGEDGSVRFAKHGCKKTSLYASIAVSESMVNTRNAA